MKLRPLLMTVTNAANCGLFQVYTEVRIFEDYLCHLAQKKKIKFPASYMYVAKLSFVAIICSD